MRRISAGAVRITVLVALAGLFLAQSASVTIGAGQGRNNSQCVQGCNMLRDACILQCGFDCVVFGGPGDPAFDACVSVCEDGCIDEMQECKKNCNVNHNPPSPDEP